MENKIQREKELSTFQLKVAEGVRRQKELKNNLIRPNTILQN